jgi:hypothetical protein
MNPSDQVVFYELLPHSGSAAGYLIAALAVALLLAVWNMVEAEIKRNNRR